MAVFRYRMQNVLNLKLRLEEQQKMMFTVAQNELAYEQEKLEELCERRNFYEEKLRKASKETLHIKDIIRLQEGISALDYHISEQQHVCKKKQEKLEEERIRLAEAVKERKIQEKLREKAWKQFMAQEEHAEQRMIDEMVSYQYGAENSPG